MKIIIISILLALVGAQPLVAWNWWWQKPKTIDEKRLELQRRQIDDPTNPYVNYNMGVAQYKKNQFDDAAASFDRAIQHTPDKPAFKQQAYFNLGQTEYRRALDAVGPSWEKAKLTDEVIDKALALTQQSIKQFDAVLVLEPEHTRSKKMKEDVELFQKKLLAKKYENQQKQDQQKDQKNSNDKNQQQQGDNQNQDNADNSQNQDQSDQQQDASNKQNKNSGSDKNNDKKKPDNKADDQKSDKKEEKNNEQGNDQSQKDETKGNDDLNNKEQDNKKSKPAPSKDDEQQDNQNSNDGHAQDKNQGTDDGMKKPESKADDKNQAQNQHQAAQEDNEHDDQQGPNEETMQRVLDAHTKSMLDAVEQMEGNAQKRALAHELSKLGEKRIGTSQKPW